MKRTFLSLSLLALLVSCVNDDVLTQSDFISNITITAEDIRLAEPELATRTDLSVTSSGLQFAWAAEDVVGIYPNVGDQVSFPMTKGAGTQSANFDGGGWAVKSGSTYAAYFPYSVDNTTYGRSYTALPLSYTGQRQTANSSTAHLGDYDYMVATASSPSNGTIGFKFTHINSFLYIQLTTPDAATFTKLTLTTDAASFVEKATVNIATGVITPTQSSMNLALDLANITVTAGSTLYAWLAVAPTDLSGKTIKATLTTSDDTKYEADIAGKTLATGTAYILKGTVAAEGTGGTGGDIPFGGDPAYAYVDLGLPSGTLWATCNVGAENPEDYGDYYAWGETETKRTYYWGSYKWCNGSSSTMTKYCTSSSYGTVDYKTILDPEDDVAHVKWGGNWRMPTQDEQYELRTECNWTWTQVNGVNGYKVSSKQPGNTNSIFLPAAGYRDGSCLDLGCSCNYWSSSLGTRSPDYSCYAYFNSSIVSGFYHNRYYGQSVRPVYGDKPQHAYVDLGLPSGLKWATCNVGAVNPEDYGDYYAWGETDPYYKEGNAQRTASDIWYLDMLDGYSWSSYKWCNGSVYTMTKYCKSSTYGTVDNKTVLDPDNDVAHMKWGGNWRMPTKVEQDELRTECTWTWTQLNGVNGYKVTSKQSGNTNFIFLPAAALRDDRSLGAVGSHGSYWSSSLSTIASGYAYGVYFDSDCINWFDAGSRCYGCSVRPVCTE